ncbi:phage major capsid protein [Streptomyces griseoaurantiacus]|uniref:phage major capsid protein n=1 Tax=Streptomyces griseoaurantiacus TaxID=68213 RepID=UPI003460087E
MAEIETRAQARAPSASDDRKLSGYGVVFGAVSEPIGGMFTESIAPGAWANTDADVTATFNHNGDNVLGRTRSGTLRLSADGTGIRYDIDLPDTELGRSVHELVKRGDLYGSSFTFVALADEWNHDGDMPHRTVTKFDLFELGPVLTPAYPDASVSARALERGVTTMATVDAAALEAMQNADRMTALTAELREIEGSGESRSGDDTRAAEIRSELAADQGRFAALYSIKTTSERARMNVKTTAGDLLHSKVAEARNLTSTSTAQAFTPAEYSKNFVDLLAPASVVMSSGVQRVNTKAGEWKTPRITADYTPGFVGELADLPTGGFANDLITVVPKKIATSDMLSNELINDSDRLSLNPVAKSMLRSVALGFDKEALVGTGAGDGFVGIANTVGIQTHAFVNADLEYADLAPFAEAFGLLEEANAAPSVVVMNPTRWAQLIGLKDSTGRQLLSDGAGSGTQGIQRSILGVPVKVTPYMDGNTVLVYDATEVYAVWNQDARFETSDQAGFFQDGLGVRAIARAAIAVPNAAAVVKMTIAAA